MSSATYFPAIFFCRFWHRNQGNANKNFFITWNLQFFQSTFIERGKKPMLPSIMGQNRIQFLLKQGKMWKLSKLEWASECWLVRARSSDLYNRSLPGRRWSLLGPSLNHVTQDSPFWHTISATTASYRTKYQKGT